MEKQEKKSEFEKKAVKRLSPLATVLLTITGTLLAVVVVRLVYFIVSGI